MDPFFENKKKNTCIYIGKLEITKAIAGDNVKEDDLKFTIEGPEGFETVIRTLGEFTEQENGTYVFELKDIPSGEFKISEAQTNIEGYSFKTTFSNEGGKATVKNAEVTEVEITNEYIKAGPTVTPIITPIVTPEITSAPKTITIKKTDIATDEEVTGAVIQLLDKDNQAIETWTSGKDGAHTILVDLTPGETYTLRETVAPQGYDIATDTTFVLEEDGTIDETQTTTKVQEGILLVEDSKKEEEQPDETHSVKISKVDIADGIEIEGAHIQLLDSEGNIIEELDSTIEPHEISGLKAGETYTLRETVAPDGYEITTDTTFVLKEDGTIDETQTTTTVSEEGVFLVEDAKKQEEEEQGDKAHSLKVMKNLTSEGEPIYAVDQTFYVQLFYDGGVEEPASDILPLHYQNATSQTVEFTGLEAGKTYYVREVDADGTVVDSGVLGGVVYVATLDENEITISTDPETGTQTYVFANEFVEIPDGFYRDGEITVTKKVLSSAGAPKAVDKTFYVGFFDDKELTKLSEEVEYPILALEMGGSDTISYSTRIQVAANGSYTLYVAEVDEDGNPVSKDASFAYTVSMDKDSVTITNTEKATATATPTAAPTAAASRGGANTGDDTDYASYLALLSAALLEYSGLKRPGCRGSGTIVPQQ